MLSLKFNTISRLTLLACLLAVTAGSFPALAGPVLKGNVSELNKRDPNNSGPGLNRQDLNRNDDAFGNNDTELQQTAPPSFAVESTLPPAAPQNFGLQAQDTGNEDFNPAYGNAMPDQMQQQQAPRQLNTVTPSNFNPQDPDSSPSMQLQWDIWHKRVANAVYQRYSNLSNVAFGHSRQPLLASVSYVVTRDGRIANVRMLQPSMNPVYNTLIMGVINSISGDPSIVSFPPGSRRMMVEKSATFSQNYGHEGYKYTTGDRETVKGQAGGSTMRPMGR